VLVGTGQYERLRLLIIGFSAALAITVLTATLLPAVGTYVHLDLRAVAPTGLPDGSGDYHLDNFRIARSGAQLVLGPLNVSGVVTFPSFHAVMALLVGWGCWRTPWLRWPALAYCLATLFATVPLGGQYVVDLAAGGLLLAAVLMLARGAWAGRRAQPMLAPAE
jgi:membrane-associated phospholipid phosphatase